MEPAATETYADLLSWAYDLQKFGIKFGLSSTGRLLETMGSPHLDLKCVHIGGTNGKGSVAAMISAALKTGGYKVGLYSSPHLVSFEERFKINDVMISREKARSLMASVKKAVNQSEPPTFFEFTTAMAFQLFGQEQTDLAILEVGMGGRLDATNLVNPLVSIITNISLEHQEYLGQTLLEIAGEKAGIIKEGVPLVSAAAQSDVLELFSRICREKESPFYLLGRDFHLKHGQKGMTYLGMEKTLEGFEIGLAGEHQEQNCATALCVLELLDKAGYSWNEKALVEGLKNTSWPGRFQKIPGRPLLILDGAHNPDAARALVKTIKNLFGHKKVVMVLGIMKDKDIKSLIPAFLDGVHEAVLSRPVYARSSEPQELARAAVNHPVPFTVCTPLIQAIELARHKAGPDGVVVISGSLFTVGEAMEKLGINP